MRRMISWLTFGFLAVSFAITWLWLLDTKFVPAPIRPGSTPDKASGP